MAAEMDVGDQARAAAAAFAGMASCLDDYRTQHFDELSPEQRAALREAEQRLDDVYNRLVQLAIQGTFDSISGDLARIEAVTSAAQKSLARLNRYEEVLKIAAAAIEIGTAALSGDAGMIANAIEDLANLLPKQT
jgi:hypothetical protein